MPRTVKVTATLLVAGAALVACEPEHLIPVEDRPQQAPKVPGRGRVTPPSTPNQPCQGHETLFGYWSFEGSLADATGADPIVAQSKPGAGDSGPASYAAGKIGQGLSVGGCSGSYCFGHNVVASGAETRSLFRDDFTISVWIKSQRPSSWDQNAIISKSQIVSVRRWTGNGRVQVLLGPYARLIVLEDNSGIVIGEGGWHHVSVVRRGSTVSLTVDGRGTATARFDEHLESDEPLYFGRYDSGYPWEGELDELGLWTAGLSDQQISGLYNNGSGAGFAGCQ